MSWVQFQWNKHSLIPGILWVRNFCQSNPFFPFSTSLPRFLLSELREGCSLLSLSIFFPPRFSGCSWLSPAHPHSQSHPNHPDSPTFPPGTPQFSLSLDKSSPSSVLKGIFSSASLNSKERLEKATLELFLAHGFVCLTVWESWEPGVGEWQGGHGIWRVGTGLELIQKQAGN